MLVRAIYNLPCFAGKDLVWVTLIHGTVYDMELNKRRIHAYRHGKYYLLSLEEQVFLMNRRNFLKALSLTPLVGLLSKAEAEPLTEGEVPLKAPVFHKKPYKWRNWSIDAN